MDYTVASYNVRFPHQAYGVQLGFMAKVLQTLNAQSNALLEAPTGSGKTLSLLCAALAWQERLKHEGPSASWDMKGEQSTNTVQQGVVKHTNPLEVHPAASQSNQCSKPGQVETAEPIPDQQGNTGLECRDLGQSDGEEPQSLVPNSEQEERTVRERRRVPKIYYATRTHSQIAQVVRELKRTTYRPKMAILASRDHYCVHKTVMKKANKDEECDKLLGADGAGCLNFKNTASKMYHMQTSHALQVHDIEDLCRFANAHKGCPYYAARHFAGEAELVFCPYNYIIDPVVRAAMDIDIGNAVLIFDEAHNIEDNARDAASAEIDLGALEESYAACVRVNQMSGRPSVYGSLAERMHLIVSWLKARAAAGLKEQSRDSFEGVWSGRQALAELQQAGLDAKGVETLQKLYTEVRAEEDKEKEAAQNQKGPEAGAVPRPSQMPTLKLGGLANGVISRLLTTLRLMYEAGSEHVQDYRLAVQRWMRTGPATFQGRRGSSRAMQDDEDHDVRASGWAVKMCLWCLNPAMAFWEVNNKARSVVLTSGTLAPLDSFASELGADFPVRLEAPHVVNIRKQVLAAVMQSGPNGDMLQATYKFNTSSGFQDSVGQALLETCQTVPDGVLVFMPSYSLLDRLVQRWQTSGLWQQLNSVKPVVCEPRGSGDDFDKIMADYYTGIRRGKGGIFLAVCRGKVSEGLDFADANARAVLVIGIPYPNVKDTKVELKKRYNDDGHRSRGLLTGDHWYSQQAFRALNQAIGRCIRHRHDYGAILLLDERFRQPRNQQHLSRWVKGALAIHPNFASVIGSARSFFQRLSEDPPGGLKPGAPPALLEQDSRPAPIPPPMVLEPLREPGRGESMSTGLDATKGQVASAAQPTLRALWQKPAQQPLTNRTNQQQARLAASKPGAGNKRQQPATLGGTCRPPSSWVDCDTALAAGWIVQPPSDSAIAVEPGQVPMTQNRGNGAAGVYGAFASTQPYQPGNPTQQPQQLQLKPSTELPTTGKAVLLPPDPAKEGVGSSARQPAKCESRQTSPNLETATRRDCWPAEALHPPQNVLAAQSRAADAEQSQKSLESDAKRRQPDSTSTAAVNTVQPRSRLSASSDDALTEPGVGQSGYQEDLSKTNGNVSWASKATIRAWLQTDLDCCAAVIAQRPEYRHLSQSDLKRAAAEGILECFLMVMECSLAEVLQAWISDIPTGLQLIATAHHLTAASIPVSAENAAVLQKAAETSLPAAVEAMALAYGEGLQELLTLPPIGPECRPSTLHNNPPPQQNLNCPEQTGGVSWQQPTGSLDVACGDLKSGQPVDCLIGKPKQAQNGCHDCSSRGTATARTGSLHQQALPSSCKAANAEPAALASALKRTGSPDGDREEVPVGAAILENNRQAPPPQNCKPAAAVTAPHMAMEKQLQKQESSLAEADNQTDGAAKPERTDLEGPGSGTAPAEGTGISPESEWFEPCEWEASFQTSEDSPGISLQQSKLPAPGPAGAKLPGSSSGEADPSGSPAGELDSHGRDQKHLQAAALAALASTSSKPESRESGSRPRGTEGVSAGLPAVQLGNTAMEQPKKAVEKLAGWREGIDSREMRQTCADAATSTAARPLPADGQSVPSKQPKAALVPRQYSGKTELSADKGRKLQLKARVLQGVLSGKGTKRVLSNNAAAAELAKQRSYKKPATEAVKTKADGWDTDSDMDAG